jgi:predicted RNA-binding protein with PIN domain
MSGDHLIVVDGYNLIHRSPELRPGPERTLQEAREKVVNLLSWAVGAGDARFLVVFDGAEGSDADMGGNGRVQVRWSKPPAKADDLIRRIVEDEMERVDRLTVVTADLEVARHARAMGADIALSDLFLGSMLGPGREREADEKPGTMSRKELEEWAKVFRAPRPGDAAERDE